MLIELQENRIVKRCAQCGKRNDDILLPPQVSLPHHQMGNVAVLWVDHEFVYLANIAIRCFHACATVRGQLSPGDLFMFHGYLDCFLSRSNIG